MGTRYVLRFLFWLQALLLPYCRLAICEQQFFGHQTRLRKATHKDVDDITTVIIAAFSSLPSWKYVHQFALDYPEEQWNCLRLDIAQALSHASFHVEVIEAPAGADLSVVAVAVWKPYVSQLRTNSSLRSEECTYKDLNLTRAFDFDHKFTAQKRKHVDNYFGTNQRYLQLLGTHPEYQSRGAGTRLVTSGIEAGKKSHVNVSLIAEPTAESFYLHLGFITIANISILSVDKDQNFRFNVMAYNFD